MKRSLFPVPLATACRIYRYRICIAALELRISAAWCMSLALSTSAEAEMILALDSRSVLEVMDRSAWSSGVMVMSLMKICSTNTPRLMETYPIS